jgi:phage host-nuclease inhibitor protein Gam
LELEDLTKDKDAYEWKIKELEDEIKLLEKKVIPNYVKENEDEIKMFMHSNAGVLVRGLQKMLKVDTLVCIE